MILPAGLSIREMTHDDIGAGLALCRASGWNQTERDWLFFLGSAVHGALVAEDNGRVVATTATLPLRLLAPALVATTIALFVTGVLLLAAGHKSDTLLLLHKVSFIVWGVVFGVHFLAYVPRVVRTLVATSRAARGEAVPGAGLRGLLLTAALGGGAALALSLLSTMEAWHA